MSCSAAGLSSEDDLQHADDEELVAITTGTSGDGSTSEAEPFLSTSLPDGIQQSVNAMPSSVDSVPEGDHAFNTATIFSENDSTTSGHETFPSNDIAPPQSTFAPFVPLPTFSPEKDVPLAPTGQHLTPSAGPSTSPIASSPPPTPSAESLGILMLSTEPWIPPPPSFDSQPTSVPPPSESMSQQQPVTTPASSAANPIVSTSATGTFQDNTANQRETHTPGKFHKGIS